MSEFTLGISVIAVTTVMWLQKDAAAATGAFVAALVSVIVVAAGAKLVPGFTRAL